MCVRGGPHLMTLSRDLMSRRRSFHLNVSFVVVFTPIRNRWYLVATRFLSCHFKMVLKLPPQSEMVFKLPRALQLSNIHPVACFDSVALFGGIVVCGVMMVEN